MHLPRTIIYVTVCAHLSRNMEAHSCQSFTGVKLPIICYSDACLSNIYALKYALTTQQPDVKPHDALVHECGHSEGTPGRQRVKTINILPPKRLNRLGPIPTNKVRFLKAGTKWSPVAKAYDATPDFDLPAFRQRAASCDG